MSEIFVPAIAYNKIKEAAKSKCLTMEELSAKVDYPLEQMLDPTRDDFPAKVLFDVFEVLGLKDRNAIESCTIKLSDYCCLDKRGVALVDILRGLTRNHEIVWEVRQQRTSVFSNRDNIWSISAAWNHSTESLAEILRETSITNGHFITGITITVRGDSPDRIYDGVFSVLVVPAPLLDESGNIRDDGMNIALPMPDSLLGTLLDDIFNKDCDKPRWVWRGAPETTTAAVRSALTFAISGSVDTVDGVLTKIYGVLREPAIVVDGTTKGDVLREEVLNETNR